MRKQLKFILPALTLAFFIYVFYRTEKTVINSLLLLFIQEDVFLSLKSIVQQTIPLNEHFIYSLPGGLWVFCATLVSMRFCISFKQQKIDLTPLPLIFAIGIELFQFFHITDGTFDIVDVLFSATFWVVAYLIGKRNGNKTDLSGIFNLTGLSFMSAYLIIFLSDVLY